MKLLILGGAGDMGSFIVRDSVKFGHMWTEITISDLNIKHATRLMSELNDPRVKVERIDATKHEELVSVLKRHDVACSAIGPFYIFGPKVARAAIEAKTPLIDICDDYGPTLEVLKMDEDSRKANIPIFLGYGWTPGLTNLLVLHASNKLDKNHSIEVDISWAGGAADSEGLAVIMHVLYAITGEIPSFQGGELIKVPAGKGNVEIDFPPPIGKIRVFDCGHPEPVTIPRFLPFIKRCTLKGGLTPDWNNKFAEAMKQLHLTQGKKRKDILAKIVHMTEKVFATGGIAASSARVDIKGIFKGREIYWIYSTPSIVMGELTGYTAAITTQLYSEKKISGIGVIPPEALPPIVTEFFFNELKKRRIELIFDESDPLKFLNKPKVIHLGFFSKYGFLILILIGISAIILLLIFLITTII